MTPKLIGSVMIFAVCGGVGFSMASNHRQKEKMLRQLITAVQYMGCELAFRHAALPQLMAMCAEQTTGQISQVFRALAKELERQVAPDAACCMAAVLTSQQDLPTVVKEKLQLLGQSIGRFDLQGQISGLETVEQLCQRELDGLLLNRDARIRSYVTLGLCAGVALVILFS